MPLSTSAAKLFRRLPPSCVFDKEWYSETVSQAYVGLRADRYGIGTPVRTLKVVAILPRALPASRLLLYYMISFKVKRLLGRSASDIRRTF